MSGSQDGSRGIPVSRSKPQNIPNLSNLSLLSESSVGSWERGRLHSNARSPPTHSSILSSAHDDARPSSLVTTMSVASAVGKLPAQALEEGSKGQSTVDASTPTSAAQQPYPDQSQSGKSRTTIEHITGQRTATPTPSSTGPASASSTRPTHIDFASQPPALYPRQAREGYGFRPASGASTPTGYGGPIASGSSSSSAGGLGGQLHPTIPFSPIMMPSGGQTSSSRATGRDDDDDGDHRPDGRLMEDLRQEVRGELVRTGMIEGTNDSVADEEGVGWPGMPG